jgi:hypothetical protein
MTCLLRLRRRLRVSTVPGNRCSPDQRTPVDRWIGLAISPGEYRGLDIYKYIYVYIRDHTIAVEEEDLGDISVV